MTMSAAEAVTMPGAEEGTRYFMTPAPPDEATTSLVSQRNVSPGLGTDKIPTSAAATVAPVTHFPDAATTAINDNDNSGIITGPQRASSDNPLSPYPGESDTAVSFTEEGGRTADNYPDTRGSAASDSSDAFSRSSPTPAYVNNTTFTAPTDGYDPQSRALSQLFTESTTSISTSFVPTTNKISVSTHPSGAETSWRNLAHTTTGGQRPEVPSSIPPTSFKEVVITQSIVVGGENISSTETMTNDGTGPGVHAGTAGDLTSRDPGLVNETGGRGATETTPATFSESLDALDSSSVSDDGSGLTGTYVTDPSGLLTEGRSPLSVAISEGRAGDKISPTTSSTVVGTSPLPGVTEINETRTEINEAVTLEDDKMSSAQVDTRVTTPAAYNNNSSESVSFKTTDSTSHGKQTSFTSSGRNAPSTSEDSAGTGQTDMSTNAVTSTAIPPSVSTAETVSIYNNFTATLPVSDGTSESSRLTVSTVQDVGSTSRLPDVTSHIPTTSQTTSQAETTSQATSPAETTRTSPAPVTSARPPAPSTVATTASWGRETTGAGDPGSATAAPMAGGLAAGAIAGIVIVVILVLVIVVLLVLFFLRRARQRRSSGDEEENPADYDYRINGNDKVSRYDNHNHGNAHGNHNNHVSSPGNDNMAMDVLESPKPHATYFKPQSGTSLDSMGSDVPPTFSVNVTGARGSPEEGRGDSDPEPDGSQGLQMPAALLNQSRVSIGPIMLSMGDDSDNAPVGAYDNMYSAGTFRD